MSSAGWGRGRNCRRITRVHARRQRIEWVRLTTENAEVTEQIHSEVSVSPVPSMVISRRRRACQCEELSDEED